MINMNPRVGEYERVIYAQLEHLLKTNNFWDLRWKLGLLDDASQRRDYNIYTNFIETHGEGPWSYTVKGSSTVDYG